jgi:hypothetical protein
MPVQPIQLENVSLPGYLDGTRVLLMTYEGMKPLTPDVHDALANWTRQGGTLVFVDDDKDPFFKVREWWNSEGLNYATPRQHLFERLGLVRDFDGKTATVGKGRLVYLRKSPNIDVSRKPEGAKWLADQVRSLSPNMPWKESSSVVLRRGPYIVAAGMDETDSPRQKLTGSFVDLFDPELRVQKTIDLGPDSRHFLIDLDRFPRRVVASAGQVIEREASNQRWRGTIEGQSGTRGVLLLKIPIEPKRTLVGGAECTARFDRERSLLWLEFENQPRPQPILIEY